MSCCEHKNDKLCKFNVSDADVSDFVGQWGQDVLNLIAEALESGLTLDFVKHVLDFFGPYYLTFAVVKHKLNKLKADNKFKGPVAPIIEADVTFESGLTDVILQLLAKVIPVLLQQLNPQVIDAIIKAIVDALNGNNSKLKAAIVEVVNEK